MNLAAGFEWHAVLGLSPQLAAGSTVPFHAVPPSGRRVIFEIGSKEGAPKVTLGLDDANYLFFAAIDLERKEHVLVGMPEAELVRPHQVGCAIGPADDGKTQLLLMVNGVVRERREVRANFGGPTEVIFSLGTDVNGEHPAAFHVMEVVAYERLLTPEVRSELRQYFQGKHAALQER